MLGVALEQGNPASTEEEKKKRKKRHLENVSHPEEKKEEESHLMTKKTRIKVLTAWEALLKRGQ